jgi:hypothetical protein
MREKKQHLWTATCVAAADGTGEPRTWEGAVSAVDREHADEELRAQAETVLGLGASVGRAQRIADRHTAEYVVEVAVDPRQEDIDDWRRHLADQRAAVEEDFEGRAYGPQYEAAIDQIGEVGGDFAYTRVYDVVVLARDPEEAKRLALVGEDPELAQAVDVDRAVPREPRARARFERDLQRRVEKDQRELDGEPTARKRTQGVWQVDVVRDGGTLVWQEVVSAGSREEAIEDARMSADLGLPGDGETQVKAIERVARRELSTYTVAIVQPGPGRPPTQGTLDYRQSARALDKDWGTDLQGQMDALESRHGLVPDLVSSEESVLARSEEQALRLSEQGLQLSSMRTMYPTPEFAVTDAEPLNVGLGDRIRDVVRGREHEMDLSL